MLELGIHGNDDEQLANVVVDPIKDRHGRSILQVRDQNTFAEKLRQKRLMTLIDVLYDMRRRVIITAETSPEKIYFGQKYDFEFDRTISRLNEMQSSSYMEAA